MQRNLFFLLLTILFIGCGTMFSQKRNNKINNYYVITLTGGYIEDTVTLIIQTDTIFNSIINTDINGVADEIMVKTSRFKKQVINIKINQKRDSLLVPCNYNKYIFIHGFLDAEFSDTQFPTY